MDPRSRSLALSDGHESGAKYCSSDMAGLSSSTESLSSYEPLLDFTDPLPTETQTLPFESTTGDAPPIHIAPWLSPVSRIDLEVALGTAGLGNRDHITVVVPAVAVVSAETEHHPSLVECETRSLKLGQRSGARRIDDLVEQYLAGVDV